MVRRCALLVLLPALTMPTTLHVSPAMPRVARARPAMLRVAPARARARRRATGGTATASADVPAERTSSEPSSYLRHELGLSEAQMSVLAEKLPSIERTKEWITMPEGGRVLRELTVEECVRPVLQTLCLNDFSRADCVQLLLRFPDVLACSTDDIDERLGALRRIGLTPAQVVHVDRQQQLHHHNNNNSTPTQQQQVVNVTTRFPPLLRYDIDTKLAELRRAVAFDDQQIAAAALAFPPLFNVDAAQQVATMIEHGFSAD